MAKFLAQKKIFWRFYACFTFRCHFLRTNIFLPKVSREPVLPRANPVSLTCLENYFFPYYILFSFALLILSLDVYNTVYCVTNWTRLPTILHLDHKVLSGYHLAFSTQKEILCLTRWRCKYPILPRMFLGGDI